VVKNKRGFTLLEIVITIAIFGVFLMIIVSVTLDMRKNESKYPVDFMTHPEVSGLVARFRKDIFDTKYFPAEFKGYKQTSKTLVMYTLRTTGFAETVVYDFQTHGEVHRKSYNATDLTGDWVARGVPTFDINDYKLATGQDAVRLRALDDKGRLAIDQIFLQRAHD
jgi:prepilin-type N-terminal cleavage/methylation domain-containing protein